MYCNSCGSPINEGQAFCANCGAPIAQPQPVSPKPAAVPAKRSNGTAITAFVLGLFTLALSWVIFFNIISVFTGLAGVILAILSLTKKNCSLKVMAIIGLVTSSLGMIYSILTWISFWSNDVHNFLNPIYELLY